MAQNDNNAQDKALKLTQLLGGKNIKYRNIHTGEEKIFSHIEIINNYPMDVKICIMKDGTRYNPESLIHWERLP